MTVPAIDDSPRRLFQQSIPAVLGAAASHADPLALRQLVEAVVQETLQRARSPSASGPARTSGQTASEQAAGSGMCDRTGPL